ncbi:MAG: glutamate--cysteine ligase [Legionellales bacterium RIFCSPHIGHO2_12_FULL_42_9]|nr:MAG: glutamate--cysteine ligase [Legionellales bacterium RIFCSPHIGHO2_12_FULL_42_9]
MSKYSLFSVIGLEIEYMLVDRDTLDIRPISDVILTSLAGRQCNEAILGDIAVSNELVLHVVELKHNGPQPITAPLAHQFQQAIAQIQPVLNEHNVLFLPTGAHPWMNPHTETERWPHGNNAIYQQFDTIFNCQGHGWANLQSMHVNLPFANDTEFFQLHSAIRLLLPLMPALAASTPFLDGQYTGFKDTRLHFYGINQLLIPAISGDIIPEFVHSIAEYQEQILSPMYDAIRPYDPNNILQYEWLNSRGAIPKFDYGAIEIRLLDTQECVHADIALAKLIVAVLKKWLGHSHYFLEHPCPMTPLKLLYQNNVRDGLATKIDYKELMTQWQIPTSAKNSRDVWSYLIEQVSGELDNTCQKALETILSQGNLSDRLLSAIGGDYQPKTFATLYRQLSDCLLENKQFSAL